MSEYLKRPIKGDIASRKAGRSLYDQAYEALKEMILTAELPPGFVAIEKEMSERLGMSRTPIREALLRLEYEGMIAIFPRRGFQVSSTSSDDIREIFRVLSALEVTAAEQLAEKDDIVRAEACAWLDAAVAAMTDALGEDDLDDWAAADSDFHRLLLDCCGNKRLKTIAETMWNQAHRVRLVTLRLRPKPSGSTDDHADLVDAIRRGDADAAREIHRAHRKKYMRMLMNLMDKYRLNHV